MVLEQFVRQLAQLGVADVILPFFLIFALVYAILQNVRLFKDAGNEKAIHVTLGLIVGAAVVFMHVLQPRSPFNVVPMINTALPWVAAILVIVLAVQLIIAMFSGDKANTDNNFFKNYLLPIVGVIVLYIFFAASNILYTPPWFRNIVSGPWISIIIALLVFGGIVYFIVRGD